ncbi:putative calcium-binding protein cml18 [Turnera subulata]|uniref:Calcium-binding protein cml18 n=1 Tax=Turnera subulata TaxID=218843 RepID=A0A9Q0JBQ8_9ROSI|nr:putative calcium-binding protein cml18 [Turnera subulata]
MYIQSRTWFVAVLVIQGSPRMAGVGQQTRRKNIASQGNQFKEKELKMSGKDLVGKLDQGQLSELLEIFRSFDRNKDGSLTQLELGSLLRSLGLKPSEDQLEGLIQKADKNNNGMIEFSEFVELVEPDLVQTSCPYTEEEMRRIFRLFDRDGNGYITPAELAHSMAKLGHALTAEELTGMIKEADLDGDGCISFPEFAQAITAAAFDNSWR